MSRPMDRHTVDRLVVEHLSVAMRLAQRLTHDANTAEDLMQEALCRILDRWKSYRGEAAFSTWMLQIVVNLDRDRRRRRKPHELIQDYCDENAPEPSSHAAAAELRGAIRTAIDDLPDRQREVALLCLGEGLPASDVAYILDITEANVHTSLHLARKRIAQAIGVNYMRRTET